MYNYARRSIRQAYSIRSRRIYNRCPHGGEPDELVAPQPMNIEPVAEVGGHDWSTCPISKAWKLMGDSPV